MPPGDGHHQGPGLPLSVPLVALCKKGAEIIAECLQDLRQIGNVCLAVFQLRLGHGR